MTEVASINLSLRYEQRLFPARIGAAAGKVVPAVIITGFLGAGKTTLLQHLLRSGHDLRLGVLINEVGEVDVDSQLVNAKQSNAAVGVNATELAGGCACCAVQGQLEQALADLVSSASYGSLDALVVETSGVADAEPLAHSLAKRGFRLDCIVAVVDADAGLAALEQPIAVAQVRAADIVVLNKCDVATLGAISDVEDRLQALAPGIRLLRARFGQVPLEAVLDVEVQQAHAACNSVADGTGAAGSADLPASAITEADSNTASSSAAGEVAFLSHEGFLGQQPQGQRQKHTGVRRKRPAVPAASGRAPEGTHTDHQHRHSELHHGFQSVSVVQEAPLCMACFQRFVQQRLVHAEGLFRAKGLLWFQQRRSARYIFHLSGRQRIQCMQDGSWEHQPRTQLVLIGQDAGMLQQLQQQLLACMAAACACTRQSSSRCEARPSGAGAASEPTFPAAAKFAELVAEHPRFHIRSVADTPSAQQAPAAKANGVCSIYSSTASACHAVDGVVEFSVEGSPLHGVIADEVNAAVVCKVNASGVVLFYTSSPATISSSTGLQMVESNVASLQTCWTPTDGGDDAVALWARISATAAPVLRKAFQHVHNCKCDVAAAAAVQLG